MMAKQAHTSPAVRGLREPLAGKVPRAGNSSWLGVCCLLGAEGVLDIRLQYFIHTAGHSNHSCLLFHSFDALHGARPAGLFGANAASFRGAGGGGREASPRMA